MQQFGPAELRRSDVGLDSDPLLNSSRKALISVTEVELQKLMSECYVHCAPNGILYSDFDQWAPYFDSFLEKFEGWLLK